MKKIFLSMAASILMLFSLNALADKLIISGEPVVVNQNGDMYALPSNTTYTPSSEYYYVTVGDTRRVCYREAQPNLASVDLLNTSLKIGGETVAVHCYTYSPEYFTVQ